MSWNWEQLDWPEFTWDAKSVAPLEEQFLRQSGEFVGAFRHVDSDAQIALRIELLSEEAVKTSEIEGDILDRDSVQLSLRHALGLGPDQPNIPPAERGIAEMMVDLYDHFSAPIANQTMLAWHSLLLSGDRSIKTIGSYRAHDDPMQVISGPIHKRTVHFEAPPSSAVPGEMRGFITWFNATAPKGTRALPALTRAGITHLYFVCIHPFEDGNGRIRRVDFYVAKAKFYERLRNQLNERQAKVITRMFKEGIDGFKGGLSAENYISIANTSRATATRDLHDLVEKRAFTRTGERRHTRYYSKLREG